MTAPVTLVCGFGRCGSSLVMQMLAAGGMPTTGRAPAYEDARAAAAQAEGNDAAWLAGCGGRAVKLLDPHRFRIPAGLDCRIIWLERDPHEQAKSQAKLVRFTMGIPVNRQTVLAFERSYGGDRPRAIATLNSAQPQRPILTLTFESLLATPHDAVSAINQHCDHIALDSAAMVRTVRPRPPRCAPGLDMELTLIAERDAREATR